MAGYNRVVMIGNLTRDPEYRQLASGQSVCRLGLASNRQFKNRQTGDMIQEVCFVDIDVWGAQAESCNQYLAKGRSVLVEGRLKFDTWEDQNGQTRSKHSIVADRVVFLSSAAETSDAASAEVSQQSRPTQKTAPKPAQQSQLDPEIEKELADQIEQIKKRSKPAVKDAQKSAAPSAQAESQPTATSEGSFKDEPPFKEDLPF